MQLEEENSKNVNIALKLYYILNCIICEFAIITMQLKYQKQWYWVSLRK